MIRQALQGDIDNGKNFHFDAAIDGNEQRDRLATLLAGPTLSGPSACLGTRTPHQASATARQQHSTDIRETDAFWRELLAGYVR
jgi:hypothetical protein